MKLSTDFDTLERRIDCDDRVFTSFSPFQCQEHFNSTKSKVEGMFNIIQSEPEEPAMIYRAQFVFIMAAFDFYMHELTKYALDLMNRDIWECSSDFLKINVEMEIVQKFRELTGEEYQSYFLEFITKKYSSVTLMNGEVVCSQLNLLGLDTSSISKRCCPDCDNHKKEFITILSNLFEKRNKIAHQVDQSHRDASEYNITETEVRQCITKLSNIVDNITLEVNEKNKKKDLKNEFLVWDFSEAHVGTSFDQFKTDYKKFNNEHDNPEKLLIPFFGELSETDIESIEALREHIENKILVIKNFKSKGQPFCFLLSDIVYSEDDYEYTSEEKNLIPQRYVKQRARLVFKVKYIEQNKMDFNKLINVDRKVITKDFFVENDCCLTHAYLKKYT